MPLRPISFSIPSTTELKVSFNESLSLSLNALNFSVERLSGDGKDIQIKNVEVSEKSVLVTVEPQSSGAYYVLHLLSPEENKFESVSGEELIHDDISRSVYFVGITEVNPVRDYFLTSVPQLFETSNSLLSDVLSAQSEEFYTAQKKVGQLLSDNYISINVKDELRTRTGSFTDRLANENAFKIDRVSKNITGAQTELKKISFSNSFDGLGRSSFPYYPIALQEEIIEEEEISLKSGGNSFKTLVFSLAKKNITKILAVTLIQNGEEQDCKGEIGTAYDIEKYRYSILDNKYDPEFGFSNRSLSSNEFGLSYFSNLPELGVNDKLLVRYAYKDFGQLLENGSLSVYSILEKQNESVPTNSVRFSLKNSLVTNSSGEAIQIGGVTFTYGENSSEIPACFQKEIRFNASRLPSSPGEYSINYEAGEVYLYGTSTEKGTGRLNIYADYFYKRVYKEGVDYFISENDIVAAEGRSIINSDVILSFSYEPVFAQGIDFISKSHIEVIEEQVENRLATSFGVKVKNTPITDVFKISNQTTGEVYNLLYHNKDTIYFFGDKSPRVSSVESEGANFQKISDEKVQVVGQFVSPAFDIQITSATSRTDIQFSPPIPSELINYLSDNYVLRGDINEQDRRIIFFGIPDVDGLISSFAIDSDAELPSLAGYLIGVKTFEINLDYSNILNSEFNSIGNFSNSSVQFSQDDLFQREKFYNQSGVAKFNSRDDFNFEKDLNSDSVVTSNLSRIRKPGDFCVDYEYGKIFVGCEFEQDLELGFVSYSHSKIETLNQNVLYHSGVVKKANAAVEEKYASENYEQITSTSDGITVLDLEQSLQVFDGETSIENADGSLTLTCLVQDDYTAFVSKNILGIRAILTLDDLFGSNLDSILAEDRYEEASSQTLDSILSGGRNLFDEDKVSFSNNKIDFKSYAKRRAFASGGLYSFDVLDGYATAVYKVIRHSRGTEISHPSLVSTITDGNIHIEFSTSVAITPGEIIEVVYLTSCTPEVGAEISVDYDSGDIFASYAFLWDQISISYEYGDNTIEWDSSASIYEGERYYVSYKYGALRRALRQNFGGLTEIPMFREFPLTFDREIYRAALRGTLQAFAKGPTIPSYKELIKAITDTEPEINESALSSWILGRDNVYPGQVYYNGNLKFAPCRFEEGLLVDPTTSVWIPADSNLSISQGTFSAWISPYWDGISNDASLTFDFKNIAQSALSGSKIPTKLSLLPGSNPFKKDWKLIQSEDRAGTIDWLSSAISISNFESAGDATPIRSGVNGLRKLERNINISTPTSLSASLYIDMIGALYNDIPLVGSSDTISKLSEGNPVYKPLSIASNDLSRFYALDFELRSIPDETSAPYVFSVTLTADELPDYSGPYTTRSCYCCFENNIEILEELNNSRIKVTFSESIDFLDRLDGFEIVKNSAKSFVIVDEQESVYQVVSFVSGSGAESEEIINGASAVFVNRWPINKTHVKALPWSDASTYLPSGSVTILAKTVSVILDDSSNSEAALDFNALPKIVNWSEESSYSIAKNDSAQLLIKISGDSSGEWFVFYTDCKPSSLFSAYIGASETTSGFYIGELDDSILVSSKVSRVSASFEYRFSTNDIYIGASGYHPSLPKFTISKNDYPKSCVGMPHGAEEEEGIFIWYDELAKSPLTEKLGQWVVRTRTSPTVSGPIDIVIDGDDFEITEDDFEVEHTFLGSISTDGQFSSVVKSSRDSNLPAEDGTPIEFSYRFYGNEKLESHGWYRVEESDSLNINLANTGRDSQTQPWTKTGTFPTSISGGVYRLGASNSFIGSEPFFGNSVYTQNTLPDGSSEFEVSLKVFSADPDCLTSGSGDFSSTVDGAFTGIVPVQISCDFANVKAALSFSEIGDEIICLVDGSNNEILDIIPFSWNDGVFHSYKLQIAKDILAVKLYVDSSLLSQRDFSLFSTNEFPACFAIHLMDAVLVDSEVFHSVCDPNIVDIDFAQLNANKIPANTNLEDDDIFIADSSLIELEINSSDEVDSDEILLSADKDKFILDTGDKDKSRISLFKDGKGFLNFRIIDDFGRPYSISYNVKEFSYGELFHIAASWKLNSFDKKDQMHLFVNGQEVPNIYKFGGGVPLKVNAKFSDVSEETLQNFLVRHIDYSSSYSDGEISIDGKFSSASVVFDSSFVGRSIMVLPDSSPGYPSYLVGKELIISEVSSGGVSFVTGKSLTPVSFDDVFSGIVFSFPPTIGVNNPVFTDLRNSKLRIFRTNSSGDQLELGGILYEVVDEEIKIISGDEIASPAFRANVDSRVIEFIGEDDVCDFSATIQSTDLDVHIRTFGLNLERINQVIELSETSYSFGEGKSILTLPYPEPVSLEDISITRIIQRRTSLQPEVVDPDGITEFELAFDSDDRTKFLTSKTGEVLKSGKGRKIAIDLSSDNIDFSLFDGSTALNKITVYGQTVDGVNSEEFIIVGNGVYESSRIFYKILSVEGIFKIIDADYEICSLEITELNPVSVSENTGDSCEVWDWQNGIFVLTKIGTSGHLPFELHSGFYRIDYPAYLNIPLSSLGGDIFLGSDISKNKTLNGVLDEVKISSEMMLDIRSTDIYSSNSGSVTYLYNKQTPSKPEDSDLALIHFDNPILEQARSLRKKVFLNSSTNIKFYLTFEQQEALLKVVNNEPLFVYLMLSFGFNEEIAQRTYFEVHKAGGGPLFNEASFINNNIEWLPSSISVNDKFGNSARFENVSGLKISNKDSFFRKDKGMVEFWVSPLVDTKRDSEDRYLVDICASLKTRVKSLNNRLIRLPSSASKIISIKLIRQGSEDSIFYTSSESEQILFDNISRSKITGELFGGTGVEKDFSLGATLSTDGTLITLAESLPGAEIDLVVSYISKDSSGDRFSILKDKNDHIVFYIKASGIENVVTRKVDWRKNTWHRISCLWKTGSSHDTMRMFIDGSEAGFIRFGEGLLYGIGAVYGTISTADDFARIADYTINLTDDFGIVSIGSDIFGTNSCNARMDNIRFSRDLRSYPKDSTGIYYDPNYSQNLSALYPVVADDITTKLIDFEADGKRDSFATVIDPKSGIFDFDIEVFDGFSKVIGINNGEIEDLIIELVNRLKPAHSNAYTKFSKP